MVKDTLIVSVLSMVPKNRTARWLGAGARLRLPRFAHKALVRWFVWKSGQADNSASGHLASNEAKRLPPGGLT